MKKTFVLLALLASLTYTKAEVVQRVQLKNGTVLNGFIQKQGGNEDITFQSENAIVCVSGVGATITEQVYKESELDDTWKEWAEKNHAYNGTGSDRTLTLNEISFPKTASDTVVSGTATSFENDFKDRHQSVSKVKVLERGYTIKYAEFTPNSYSFNWSDVDVIKSERRPKEALSGIDRIYQLKNGQEVKGEYAGESYNTLSLYMEDGTVQTFNIDDVVKYFYKPINPNQTIFEQSPLTDVVYTKNAVFRGVIVEKNFTDNNNYLVIMQPSGSTQTVKFDEIIDYIRENNSEYKPLYDILLQPGEVLINRMAADSVGVKKEGSYLILDSINGKILVPKGTTTTKIIVEYSNPNHMSSDNLMLVKVNKDADRKIPAYYFSADIFEIQKFALSSSETSVNNTTRLEYFVTGQGVYALYDQITKKAMPFIVK